MQEFIEKLKQGLNAKGDLNPLTLLK